MKIVQFTTITTCTSVEPSHLHQLDQLVVQALAAHVPPAHNSIAQRGEAVAGALQTWAAHTEVLRQTSGSKQQKCKAA